MTSALRSIGAAVTAVLGVLLVLLALVGGWTYTQVTDTDDVVARLAPLASDPTVQQEVTDRVTAAVTSAVRQAVADRELLPGQLGLLATPASSLLDAVVRGATTRLVQSDAFAAVWRQLVLGAHTGVVAVLTGQPPTGVVVRDGVLYLDLAPVVAVLRDRLVALGWTGVTALPEVTAQVEVGRVDQLVRARSGVRLLDRTAAALPWAAGLLLVAAVLLPRRRLRAVASVALAVALVAGLAWGAVRIGGRVVDQQVLGGGSGAAADAVWRALTAGLSRSLAVTALVAVALGVAAGVTAAVRANRPQPDAASVVPTD